MEIPQLNEPFTATDVHRSLANHVLPVEREMAMAEAQKLTRITTNDMCRYRGRHCASS